MAAKKKTAAVEAVEAVEPKPEVIVSFKGFDAELKCRGFQYEVGATYTHKGKVEACESGFHGCENPLDVLGYYQLLSDDAKMNRFAVVEQSGEISRHGEDTKIASASITITAELTLPDFIKRSVTWLMDSCKPGADEKLQAASGHYSQLAASGNSSVIASSSYSAVAKGGDGTWIALAEYNSDAMCVGFAVGCIGQDGLLPDTWYRAKGGKLVMP